MNTALYDLTNLLLLGFGALIGAGVVYAHHLRQMGRWQQSICDAELRAQQDVDSACRLKEEWRKQATHQLAETQRAQAELKRLQAMIDGAAGYEPTPRPIFPRPLGLRDRRVG